MSVEMDVNDEPLSTFSAEPLQTKKPKNPIPSENTRVCIHSDVDWFNAYESLNSNLHILNSSTGAEEEKRPILDSLKLILININDSIKTISSVSSLLNKLILFLIDLLDLKHIDVKIRSDIVKIVYTLWRKELLELDEKKLLTIICFLVENYCVNQPDKTSMPFIKILRKLLPTLKNEDLKITTLEERNKLKHCLMRMLLHTQFCTTDNGVEIVGRLVALNEEFVKEFHEFVKKFLVKCKKSEASKFGKIYHKIWDSMSEDDQKNFEECYIQRLMEHAFTMGRRQTAVRNLSVNLQSLLSGIHVCRSKGKFSGIMSTLYSPLLWKYLNSSNNIHRCNAAEIFMDVYPLERPGGARSDKLYSKYLRKQHEEMLALLEDPCPTVRIIAIKGICSNLKYFWNTFQNGTAEIAIEIFIKKLVVDGSSPEVRKAVYQGLSQLLECAESHCLLKGVIPSLGGFIHDENQSVRRAFIGMLMKLKELKHKCDIKYHHIVNLYNVASRLANDSPKNRQLIVRLIFSSFYTEKMDVKETFKRLRKFISVNPSASRYLAMYSKSELPFENAVYFMCSLLLALREQIERKMEISVDENTKPSDYDEMLKSKAEKNVLTSVENISVDGNEITSNTDSNRTSTTINDSDLNRTSAPHDPRIAHGLLDFVAMLWLIHGKTLQAEEHKEQLEKIHNTCAKCIPPILRYFKGTHAYFGALNVAAMVPLITIGPVATVVGSCLSFLRQATLETPRNEIHCIIHVLCMWNRGGDVLELVKEWLDEAFRSQSLNESYAMNKQCSKKVRFPRSEPKAALALRLLDDLFSSPTDQKFVFIRDGAELRTLYGYLARVKVLVQKRIDKYEEISELLPDEFLKLGLTIYGNLIIMFSENKASDFDFWKKFTKYLQWCNEIYLHACEKMDNEQGPIDCVIFELMQIPLIQCLNLIAIGKCNDEQTTSILKFVNTMLDSDHGMHFVEISVYLIKQLILYSRVHHKDNRQTEVMMYWFPCIINRILSLLSEGMFSKETIAKYIKDMNNFRRDFIYIYVLGLKLYPELSDESNPSFKIMQSFCKSLINILLFPITECETLNVDHDFRNLSFVGSFLAGIFTAQLDLGSALLYVLKTIINRYTEKDGLLMVATASLLYTFAFSEGKIPKQEVLKVVKSTYQKLECLPANEGCLALVIDPEKTIGDRTIIDVEETTESALKEIGQHILQRIAEQLGGSLS